MTITRSRVCIPALEQRCTQASLGFSSCALPVLFILDKCVYQYWMYKQSWSMSSTTRMLYVLQNVVNYIHIFIMPLTTPVLGFRTNHTYSGVQSQGFEDCAFAFSDPKNTQGGLVARRARFSFQMTKLFDMFCYLLFDISLVPRFGTKR